MKRVVLALLVGFGLLAWSAFGAHAGQYEDGLAAYNAKDFATAVKL